MSSNPEPCERSKPDKGVIKEERGSLLGIPRSLRVARREAESDAFMISLMLRRANGKRQKRRSETARE